MSLKNNQTFPGVRGLGWQEWLRSRKLSTCPLTPSSILRQGLGPLETGENLGGSRGSWRSSGASAQVGPGFWPSSLLALALFGQIIAGARCPVRLVGAPPRPGQALTSPHQAAAHLQDVHLLLGGRGCWCPLLPSISHGPFTLSSLCPSC